MGSPAEIKNQLAQRTAQPPAQGGSFQTQLAAQFKNQFKAIQSIVPKHVTPERLIRIGMNATSRNPKLLECTPESIVGAVVNCGVLGVEPNLLGHAYIVPFWNSTSKKMEAQFQLGYKGLIDLARRTGEITNVYAHEVYEGDMFEYSYGLDKNLYHKPSGEENEAKITHFYAVYKLKDGAYDFIVMSRSQIESHRNKFTKSQKDGRIFGPWKDHFTEMGKKTVLIKLLKTAPISIEQQETKVIMEGLQRDNSISQVKENEHIGEPFIQSEYYVVEDEKKEKSNDYPPDPFTGEPIQINEDDIPFN